MNRNALMTALALGLAAVAPVMAGGPIAVDGQSRSAVADRNAPPEWFGAVDEGAFEDAFDVGSIVAKGRRSYSEARALGDARAQLERAVAAWLAPEVPDDWQPPSALIDPLIVGRAVDTVAVDPAGWGLSAAADAPIPDRLFVAALRLDASPSARDSLVDAHRREVGARRLIVLGGLGGFLLSCLAILAAYIRADEATRGYYTTRLRLLAAATAGAAGVAIYRYVLA